MDLRYPVGQFTFDGEITSTQIESWIQEIEEAPRILRETVKDLQDEQLDTPYRPGGWSRIWKIDGQNFLILSCQLRFL
ncbi:hypothetical protein PASE110613_13165 [Paenibacillus sediminis]|uniref:Uncharacterized protein n=1 Tax=Paenibacillus sediminis TaxID=664909 RepID=A0ABS4H3L6_9BACL|nr:hypothetical protein [Paenibacillus sediminis]